MPKHEVKKEKNKQKGFHNVINKYKVIPIHKPKSTSQMMRAFFQEINESSEILKVGEEDYSICFEYQDVSFSKANYEEQESIFLKFVEYLHSFNYKDHIQIIHAGTPVKAKDYKEKYVYQEETLEGNKLEIAKEFNNLIEASLGNKDKILCETRQLIITTKAESFKEAKDIFLQYQLKVEERFKELKSKIRRVSLNERLEFIYNMFNQNIMQDDGIKNIVDYSKEKNLSIYDVLAPKQEVSFREKNYIKIGNDKYIRVMYVAKLPKSITPRFYNRLTTIEDGNVIVTLNITPTDPGKVLKMIDKKISGMKTERLEKVKKALKNNYSYEVVKDEKLEDAIADAQDLRDALQKKKQKLFANNALVCIQASSSGELENLTKKVQAIGNEHLVTIYNLDWQQLEGLVNSLPVGINNLQFQRSLTSEATAANIPFNTKDLMHEQSIYYGINLVSKNPIFCDRKKLLNGNGCVIATSGAGKSFAVKTNIEQVLLRYPEDEIIVVDPQRRVSTINQSIWWTNIKYIYNNKYIYKSI